MDRRYKFIRAKSPFTSLIDNFLDSEHFYKFHETMSSLTGKKSQYEVEIEEDKDSLFGEVPKEACTF